MGNKRNRRTGQPPTSQSTQSPAPSKTMGTVDQSTHSAGSSTQKSSDDVVKLKEEIEALRKKLKEYEDKEQELQEKESRAIDGFKELEAEVRASWLQEKEARLEQQRLSIQSERDQTLEQAQTEAQRITDQAQREADELIQKNAKLAAQLRQQVREEALGAIHDENCRLENLRNQLQLEQQKLEAQLRELSKQEKRLQEFEEDLEEESEFIQGQRKKLKSKEEALAQREAMLSENKVAQLTAEKLLLEQQLAILISKNSELFKQVEDYRSTLNTVSGSPEALLRDKQRLEERVQELEQQLDSYPSYAEIADLRREAEAKNEFEARYLELQAQADDFQRVIIQQRTAKAETENLRRERDTLKHINQYLQEQQEELERMLGELQAKDVNVFANFTKMDDDDLGTTDKPSDSSKPDLASIAAQVRHWMAGLPSREELQQNSSIEEDNYTEEALFAHYYDEHTIRSFMASLAASRLLILQGVSGTGKTSLPEYFAYAVGGKCQRIEVQSSWRDKPDLLGFYNSFFKSFNESAFSRALYEANTNRWRNRPYFIVLDEMNLSRIEYYFADLLSVLEGTPNTWQVELLGQAPNCLPKQLRTQNGAAMLPIPQNVWFIGTANTDESTYEITRKVYDRAQILQFDEREPKFSAQSGKRLDLSIQYLNDCISTATANFSENNRRNAIDCLENIELYLKENFRVAFGQRIIDQLQNFLAVYTVSGGSLPQGLDHFIARKLLWQIQNRTDPNVKASLKVLKDSIQDAFETFLSSEPPICIALLEQEISRFSS